nr:tegumental antigen [Hymenolepis microstoma]
MSLDTVLEEFEAIDTEHYGFITRESLKNYVKRNKLDRDLVDKWFQWFEGDVKGIITIEDVCTVLGIPMPEKYAQKVEMKRKLIKQGIVPVPVEAEPIFAAPPTAPNPTLDDVEILHNNTVPQEMLNACIRVVRENSDSALQDSNIAQILKKYMDQHYKKYWITVVATSTVGAAVAHEQNSFIHFRYKNRLYLLYRIPDTGSL